MQNVHFQDKCLEDGFTEYCLIRHTTACSGNFLSWKQWEAERLHGERVINACLVLNFPDVCPLVAIIRGRTLDWMDLRLNKYSCSYALYWKLWLGFQNVLKCWKIYKELLFYRETFYRADRSNCAAPCSHLLLLPLVLVEVISLWRQSCGREQVLAEL